MQGQSETAAAPEPAAAPASPPDKPAAPASGAAKWLPPLLVLIAGSFLPPLDSAIINVPILHIQKALGGGEHDIIWISTAYSLGLAVFVPLSNWLADRFGLTLVHRTALIAFLIGSGACGFAWDLQSLVILRIITAIPGSMIPVVTISMIYRIVPKKSIGAAMGLYGLGVIVAPSLGPVIGGALAQDLDWPWIFWFKEPIGVAAVVVGLFLIPRMGRADHVDPFDWWGFITFGYGLSALIVVSDEGQQWHWDSYGVLILIVSGVLSLGLFAVIENQIEHPLIDLRIFKCWPFVNSLLLIGVLLIMLFGVTFYIPQFLQSAQGYDVLRAGMAMLPMGLLMVFAVPIAGRAYDKVGPRPPALIGMLISIVGLYLLAQVTPDTGRWTIACYVTLAMAGGALGMMPIMTNGLSWLPPHLVGYGGAMNNVVQRASAAFAVAIVGLMVSKSDAQLTVDQNALERIDTMPPELARAQREQLLALYQHQTGWVQAKADGNAFLATAGVAVIAVILVLTLRKPPALTGAAPQPETADPAPPVEPAQRNGADPLPDDVSAEPTAPPTTPRSTAGSPAPEWSGARRGSAPPDTTEPW